jgi:hypothetical protein
MFDSYGFGIASKPSLLVGIAKNWLEGFADEWGN